MLESALISLFTLKHSAQQPKPVMVCNRYIIVKDNCVTNLKMKCVCIANRMHELSEEMHVAPYTQSPIKKH